MAGHGWSLKSSTPAFSCLPTFTASASLGANNILGYPLQLENAENVRCNIEIRYECDVLRQKWL